MKRDTIGWAGMMTPVQADMALAYFDKVCSDNEQAELTRLRAFAEAIREANRECDDLEGFNRVVCAALEYLNEAERKSKP